MYHTDGGIVVSGLLLLQVQVGI